MQSKSDSRECQIFWSYINSDGKCINGNGQKIQLTDKQIDDWNNYIDKSFGFKITHKVKIVK